MSELSDQLRNSDVQRILEESLPKPSEPIRLESEEVFDSDLLNQSDRDVANPGFLSESEMDAFQDNPLKLYAGLVGDLKSMASRFMQPPRAMVYDPPAQDHKVRVFRLNDQANLTEVESQIESILNDGWCCHHPTVCGDFLIMDFSRRKESEEHAQ